MRAGGGGKGGGEVVARVASGLFAEGRRRRKGRVAGAYRDRSGWPRRRVYRHQLCPQGRRAIDASSTAPIGASAACCPTFAATDPASRTTTDAAIRRPA